MIVLERAIANKMCPEHRHLHDPVHSRSDHQDVPAVQPVQGLNDEYLGMEYVQRAEQLHCNCRRGGKKKKVMSDVTSGYLGREISISVQK